MWQRGRIGGSKPGACMDDTAKAPWNTHIPTLPNHRRRHEPQQVESSRCQQGAASACAAFPSCILDQYVHLCL